MNFAYITNPLLATTLGRYLWQGACFEDCSFNATLTEAGDSNTTLFCQIVAPCPADFYEVRVSEARLE